MVTAVACVRTRAPILQVRRGRGPITTQSTPARRREPCEDPKHAVLRRAYQPAEVVPPARSGSSGSVLSVTQPGEPFRGLLFGQVISRRLAENVSKAA